MITSYGSAIVYFEHANTMTKKRKNIIFFLNNNIF